MSTFNKLKDRVRSPVVVLILVGLMAGLLGACAQPPVPQDHFYRLQITSPPTKRPTPILDGVLEVTRLLADGITAGRPLAYSTAESQNEVREYHYHFWTEPPTVMLQDQLVRYLRAGGFAKSIVTPEMRVNADFVIGGKIYRLEKVVGPSPTVVLDLELSVRTSRDEKLIHVGSYSQKETAADDSVPAAVKALNDALAKIFAQFTEELSQK